MNPDHIQNIDLTKLYIHIYIFSVPIHLGLHVNIYTKKDHAIQQMGNITKTSIA